MLSPIIGYFTYQYNPEYNPDYYFRLVISGVGFVSLFFLKKNMKIPVFAYPLFLYFLYMFLWDLQNGTIDRRGYLFYFANNLWLQTLIILLIIENLEFTPKLISDIVLLTKITIICAGMVTLIQLKFSSTFFVADITDFSDKESIYSMRRPSIFGFVESNGLGMAFLPLFSTYLGFRLLKNLDKWTYLFILIVGISCVSTNSRYVIMGYFLILFQIIIVKGTNFNARVGWVIKIVGFLVIIFFIYQFFGYDFNELMNKRLASEGSLQNTTRYLAVEMFLRFFPQNPFFGTGMHLTPEIIKALKGVSSQIHVGYLSHLVSYGLVGSLFLFSFWYLLIRKLYRNAKLTGYYGSFFGFLMFLWANASLVHFSIFTYGLIIAFIFDKYYIDEYGKAKLDDSTQVI